jgi:hypothetical protein
MSEVTLPVIHAPSAELRAIATRFGTMPNCKTCANGHADHDGEEGVSWYCGMTCDKHEFPNTYLEDNGVSPEAEKACWEPDFWKCPVPEIDVLIDGTDEGLDAAGAAWVKLLNEIMPADSRPTRSEA